jgi:hypothetical protein
MGGRSDPLGDASMKSESGFDSEVPLAASPNPTSARRFSPDLPESPETYWRWGFPSLILALVTILLGLASWLYMQPRIRGRYEAMVEHGLSMEGEFRAFVKGPVGGSAKRGGGLVSEEASREAQEARERWLKSGERLIDGLRSAELAANRLTVQTPTQANPRLQSGRLALRLGETYGVMAEGLLGSEHEEKRQELRQRAFEARGRGVDAMRSATRLEGPARVLAELWILEDRVRGLAGRMTDDGVAVSQLEERFEEILRESDAPRDAYRLLGRVQLMRALELSSAEPLDDRVGKLELGVRNLQAYLDGVGLQGGSEISQDFVAEVWLAEGLMSGSREAGLSRAKRAIQGRVSSMVDSGRNVSERGVEEVDALFRALMLIGSLEEASVVVASRLTEFSLVDQELLRTTVADSCLRAIASQRYFPQGGFAEMSTGALLSVAMRVSPGSTGVVSALHSMVVESSGSDWQRWGGQTEGEGKDDGVRRVLSWLRNAYKSARVESNVSMEGVKEEKLELTLADADLLVGGLPLVFRWLQTNAIETEGAREMVDRMLKAVPQSNDLLYARAMLAVRVEDYPAAVGDLKTLLERSPGNASVERTLLDLQERMGSSPLVEKSGVASPSDSHIPDLN